MKKQRKNSKTKKENTYPRQRIGERPTTQRSTNAFVTGKPFPLVPLLPHSPSSTSNVKYLPLFPPYLLLPTRTTTLRNVLFALNLTFLVYYSFCNPNQNNDSALGHETFVIGCNNIGNQVCLHNIKKYQPKQIKSSVFLC